MSTIVLIFAMIFFYHGTEALIGLGVGAFLYVWKPDQAKKLFKPIGWVILIFFGYLILIKDVAPWVERIFS